MELGGGSIVPAILRDEMSGSALARAEDLFYHGREIFRADHREYLSEGLTSVLDFSGTGAKIALGAGVVLFAGLTIFSAPAAVVVGGMMIAGAALYGTGRMIKNSIEIFAAGTRAGKKQNILELGERMATTLMSAPFLPKAETFVKNIGNIFNAARTSGKSAAAVGEVVAQTPVVPTEVIIQPPPAVRMEMVAGERVFTKSVPNTPEINGVAQRAFREAADRLEAAEIGHLKGVSPELIGARVMTPGGEFNPRITLVIEAVNVAEQTVLVSGGRFGQRWLGIDKVRDINAVTAAIGKAVYKATAD